MSLESYHQIYFIGIGGIGMSALARWFVAQHKFVAGYDKTPTALTAELEALNIPIHFEEDVAAIPASFVNCAQRAETLIIYTPAIPATHAELQWFENQHYKVCKRAEILGLLSRLMPTIAIAGTHGKTSTTALLAYLHLEQNRPVLAFVGGISQNYQSNTLSKNSEEAKILLVEADEYDRSFLHLSPQIAIITAVESDHLDIYETFENVRNSFEEFVRRLPPGGILYLHEDVDLDVPASLQVYRYGTKPTSDLRATDIHPTEAGMGFDYAQAGFEIQDLELGITGAYNVINALPCIHLLSGSVEKQGFRKLLPNYSGVKRRFEYILRKPFIFIDDYAHHPTEVRAFLTSVRQKYPTQNITAIFQPHLFSRTRDFAREFAEALDLADNIFLLPIYPAREAPLANVSSKLIFNALETKNRQLIAKSELLLQLPNTALEVLVTIGAGDIGELVEPLKKMFESSSFSK